MLTTFAASVYSRVRPGRLPHGKKRIRHNRLAIEALERRELLAVIQGTVFEDLNGDGGLDASDPGFAGATVYLDQNQNGRFDDGEVTAQTGADGAYQLAVAEPGTYRVGQVVPSGWMQTSPGLPAGPETRGEVLTGWEAPAGRILRGAAWAGGTLYIQHMGNPTAPIIHPVDPATGLVVGPSIPVAKPIREITSDGTCFWGAGVESDRPFLASFDTSGAVLSMTVLPSPITTSVYGVEAAGQGRFWITDGGADALYLVDSTTGTIERTLAAPTPDPYGIAGDGRHLWVSDYAAGTVYQIDPATGATLDSFFVAGCSASSSSPGLRGLTFDGQNLWAVRYETGFEGQVLKLDIATPATATVTIVNAEEAAIGPDFGQFQLATVSGQVVNDLDADGVGDPGEPALADWWVAIDSNGNGRVDPWENAALSDVSGNYSLAGLRPAPHRVIEMLRQPGWVATLPVAGGWTVYPASGESLVRDFGNSLTSIGPIGGEVLVNSPTADITETLTWPMGELSPREVAMDAAGNYVVTWQSGTEIRACRYDAAQGTFGSEFVVNTKALYRDRAGPIVAMASSTGNFVISWWNGADIVMRRYNRDATPASGEIVVVAGNCYGARSIAMDADGDFALLYKTYNSGKASSNGYTFYLKRYNAAGQAQGSQIKVDTTMLANGCASLGMDNAGNMVVVWDDPGVYAQRYSAAGKTVGSRITVGPESRSNVAVNAAGEFAVVVSPFSNPYCKVYSATGILRTTFPCIAPSGYPPAVTWLPDGTLLIASGDVHDLSGSDVFAQRYDAATGLPLDPQPFLVNTTLAGMQRTPSVAADAAGNFVIAWEGNGRGDSAGIFVQRYAAPPATAKSPLLAAERVDASVATLDQTATLTDLALQELTEAHARKAKPVLLPTQAATAALLQNGLW